MKASSITAKVIALFFHPTIQRLASPTLCVGAFRPSIRSLATSSFLFNQSSSRFDNTIFSTNTKQLYNSTAISNSTSDINKQQNMSSSAAIESMPRGIGGRIEEAFAKCKERGEAAFVTFVTAGFPVKEGELIHAWLV